MLLRCWQCLCLVSLLLGPCLARRLAWVPCGGQCCCYWLVGCYEDSKVPWHGGRRHRLGRTKGVFDMLGWCCGGSFLFSSPCAVGT
ncbi:uncharacterized protein J3D65DRAFT_612127 [Phyllosticta citribraziliensis]|uniref:Secreted protein n=1 Tax=Phyllosticta citribraziliensis TaxID=989973 RepID=A0ABR1M2Z5_9PEZI